MNTTQAMNIVIGSDLDPKFKRAFKSAGKQFDALGKDIGNLKKQQKSIAAFEMKTASLESARYKLNAAQQAVRDLGREINVANKLGNTALAGKLSSGLETAKTKVDRLSTALDKQRTDLRSARVAMDKAGVDARKYAQDNDAVTRSLKRMETQQREMARLSQDRAEVKTKLRNGAVAATAGGYGLSRMMSSGIQSKSLTADIAITADLDDAQIKEMDARITALSGNSITYQGSDALRGALNEMLTQGMEFDDSMSRLDAVGLTATAASANVNDLAKTAFSLSNNMGIAGDQSQKAFDMLVLGGKKGSFELKEMAKYFPALTADAKKLGITGLEGVATLTSALQISMRTAGDPAEAANNFKNFLAKVTAPETIKKFAKEYNIDIEAEMKAAMKKGIDPMRFLVERTMDITGGDEFRVGELFGDMQAKAFLTAMSKNKADYDKMRAVILAANGTSRADADRRWQLDPQMKIDNMMEAFGSLRNNLLMPLIQPVTELATGFADMAKPMGEFVENNPLIIKGIVGVGAAGVALSTAGLIAKYSGISQGARLATGAMRLASLGLMANPVGLGVAALVGGALLVYSNWDKVSGFFEKEFPEATQFATEKANEFQAWWAKKSFSEKVMTVSTWPLQLGKLAAKGVFSWWGKEIPEAKSFDIFLTEGLKKADRVAREIIGWWQGLSLKTLSFNARSDKAVSAGGDAKKVTASGAYAAGNMSQDDILKRYGGGAVVKGITSGVDSEKSAVVQSGADLGGSLEQGFNHALEINSPSRVFHRAGVDSVKGIENGLLERKSAPRRVLLSMGENMIAANDGLLKSALKPLLLGGSVAMGAAGASLAAAQPVRDVQRAVPMHAEVLKPAGRQQVVRVEHKPTYHVTVDVAKIDANTSVETVTQLVREALAIVEAERGHSFDNALFDHEAYQ